LGGGQKCNLQRGVGSRTRKFPMRFVLHKKKGHRCAGSALQKNRLKGESPERKKIRQMPSIVAKGYLAEDRIPSCWLNTTRGIFKRGGKTFIPPGGYRQPGGTRYPGFQIRQENSSRVVMSCIDKKTRLIRQEKKGKNRYGGNRVCEGSSGQENQKKNQVGLQSGRKRRSPLSPRGKTAAGPDPEVFR